MIAGLGGADTIDGQAGNDASAAARVDSLRAARHDELRRVGNDDLAAITARHRQRGRATTLRGDDENASSREAGNGDLGATAA